MVNNLDLIEKRLMARFATCLPVDRPAVVVALTLVRLAMANVQRSGDVARNGSSGNARNVRHQVGGRYTRVSVA